MTDITTIVALLAGLLSMAVVIGAVILRDRRSPVTIASMLHEQK